MKFVIALIVAAFAAASANAASLSFRGTLDADNEVELFSFTLDTASTVSFISRGYGGGTMFNGPPAQSGGVDTVINVYNSSGNIIGFADDGFLSMVLPLGSTASNELNPDPTTRMIKDFHLQLALGPGTYTAALSQAMNLSAGSLAAGHIYDDPMFSSYTATLGCPAGQFCDRYLVTDENGPSTYVPVDRQSHWALDISGVSAASHSTAPAVVPLPAGLALLLTGIAGFCALRRLKRP